MLRGPKFFGHKRWLLLLGIIIVAALAYLLLSGYGIGPLNKNLEVHISVPSTTITKDKFVIIDGELRNHTFHSYGAPWGTCAQQLAYYMDGKQIFSEGFGAVCDIGYGDIKPGKVFKQTFTVDPTSFAIGQHSFYVNYEGLKSNTLILNFAKSASIGSCYDLTQYASPLCSQIHIVSDVSDYSDKARCESYLSYLSQSTPVRPISPLSSVDCIEKDYAVPYITVNVPKGDPDKWVARLSDHFSDTNLPNDYANVSLVTYPE